MSATSLLLAGIVLCAGAIGILVLRASPRGTVVIWTLSLFFVPVWVGVVAGPGWALTTLVTVAAIFASARDVRLTAVDGLVAAFALLVLVLFALKSATLSAVVIALSQWIVPYIWGRLVLARVSVLFVARAIAVAATAAAVLAIVEFATGHNAFIALPGPGADGIWRDLQYRGSFLRAEGAFGHSIALGASLAMSIPFIIASRWRTPVVLMALGVVLAGIAVTLSRIGLVAAAIALGVGVLLMPGIRVRVRVLVGAGAAAAAALILPFVQDVFVEAGGGAADSAAYRGSLLSLLPEVQLLGAAGDWSERTVDGVYLGTFAKSVDNALLLIGLRFGWVPMLLVVAVFAVIALGLLTGRANPATVAAVSQLPALFTVAFITQWGMLVWFVVGLAVAWSAAEDRRVEAPRAVLRLPSPTGRLAVGGASA